MPKIFDDESLTLFSDCKSDNDQDEEINNVEGDNNEYLSKKCFIYIDEMPLVVELSSKKRRFEKFGKSYSFLTPTILLSFQSICLLPTPLPPSHHATEYKPTKKVFRKIRQMLTDDCKDIEIVYILEIKYV